MPEPEVSGTTVPIEEGPGAEGRATEVELFEGGEQADVGESAGLPTPGEPTPGEPVEEVLEIRDLASAEPSADELDVPPFRLERGDAEGGEDFEERETTVEDALHRSPLGGNGLETRYEELEDEELAAQELETRMPAAAPHEFVCTRCLLRKHRSQLADPGRQLCCDCAQ